MSDTITAPSDDKVISFRIEGTAFRGQILKLGDAVEQVLARHDYPVPVSLLLGEALVLTAILGASLKFEGKLILQIQGDGPVRMLVCDYLTDGSLRGYARVDEDKEFPNERVSVPGLIGKGYLALTVDQGLDKERYQGIVALDGDTLEACALAYFAQSEQIPTLLKLSIAELFVPGGSKSWRAGGLIVQMMPGEEREKMALSGTSSDDWERISAFVKTTEDHELIDPTLSSQDLLYRLFHEEGVRVFQPKKVAFSCGCSHQKIRNLLETFSQEDRQEMLEDGVIKVRCEFCNESYEFDPATLPVS